MAKVSGEKNARMRWVPPSVGSRWMVWLTELGLLGVLYIAFSTLQQDFSGSKVPAVHNAHSIVNFERSIGINVEGALNTWTTQWGWFATINAYFYLSSLAFPLIGLVWLALYNRTLFRRFRRYLVVLTLGSLPFFAFFPVAPPRFAIPGTVDVVNDFGPMPGVAVEGAEGVALYAAVPSLHTAWAIWTAMAIAAIIAHKGHSRWAQVTWVVPALVIVNIILTGNHYWMDAFVAILLCAVAHMITTDAVAGRVREWIAEQLALDSAARTWALAPIPVERHHRHQLRNEER